MENLSDKELLQFALENGIIDLDTIQKKIAMNERRKYLEQHNHKVWKGTNDKWYTYLTDDTNERKLLKKNTENELYDCIVNHYKKLEDDPIIEKVFFDWIDFKLTRKDIQLQTAIRYEMDFNRFFKKLKNKKIRYIDCEYLEEVVITEIVEQDITKKCWGNFRILLKGIFKYAKKRRYSNIDINTFIFDLELSDRMFKYNIREDDDNIFMPEELDAVIRECNSRLYDSRRNINALAILLAAYTGMRSGEIVALKWEDIKDNYIFVRRTQIEIRDSKGSKKHEIRDFPKSEAGIRKIVIIPKVAKILKELRKINPFSEYIFEVDGKVKIASSTTVSLYRICEKLNINKRGMHCLRKTFATILINAGVSESTIISQMGHVDIEVTKGYYYYNNKTINQMKNEVAQAVNY